MKVIFICTSNKDRSPALERYFKERYPAHEFRSAGVNHYHTKKKGTHLLTQTDIQWAKLLVFVEDVHQLIAAKDYFIDGKTSEVLNAGEYDKENANNYLLKAEEKLHPYLQQK